MFKRQKLYYFCEKTLTWKERKVFTVATLYRALIISGIFILFLVGINYLTNNSVGNYIYNMIQYERKNSFYSKSAALLKGKVDSLQMKMNSLMANDKNLRLLVNLPVLEGDIKEVGIGGKVYNVDAELANDEEFNKLNEIEDEVNKISRQINLQHRSYFGIFKKYNEDKKLFECIPATKPMIGSYDKNSFGMRLHPILGYTKMHEGVDIMAPIGTPVYSPGKGVVERIGYDGGYGLMLEISNGYGYKTLFAHLSAVDVKVGQLITRGEKVAECGNSGLSSGPHLHYEVSLENKKLNPVNFFIETAQN
jgi:murein DD-endopeptidase MepM/ murein hydrolase activator NlpD